MTPATGRWSLLCTSLVLLSGCADGGSSLPGSGTVTLFADDGVNFGTGAIQVKSGNFQDSDIWATSNLTHGCLTLYPGGPKPTTNHPVDWLDGQTFLSLEDVPTEATNPVTNESLVCADTGRGFLIEAKWGGWTRAWIQAAGAESVTIQFDVAE